jgi:DNA (cytosine-5)-methyltransferase 1
VPLEKIKEDVSVGRSWKNIPPSKLSPRFKKIYDDPKKYHAPNFYRRFALAEICGTITASAQPENCGITHPFENRRMTIRGAARVQSFPDSFDFDTQTLPGAYKVIGNAVPPVLGWVIARSLDKHLNS